MKKTEKYIEQYIGIPSQDGKHTISIGRMKKGWDVFICNADEEPIALFSMPAKKSREEVLGEAERIIDKMSEK